MLSTYELQHFTPSQESLIKILKHGFEATFCCEEYLDGNNYWTPTVCFCDIPPTLSGEHKNCYGEYVIGMKQNWGRSNDIHPVHYIRKPDPDEPHSIASANNFLRNFYVAQNQAHLQKLTEEFIPIRTGDIIIDGLMQCTQITKLLNKINDVYLPLSIVWAYEKIFEGQQNLYTKEYRKFYDEREWRYIPSIELIKQYACDNVFSLLDIIINKGYFGYQIFDCAFTAKYSGYNEKWQCLNGKNRENVVKLRLEFNIDDVAFLIIPSEDDKESIKDVVCGSELVKMYTWEETKNIGK